MPADRQLAGLGGGSVAVPGPDEAQLESTLRGELLSPSSQGYDEARAVWNGMIDRRPGLIARCRDASDVAAAVRFAADHRVLVSVRGGGHNIAGNAVCDGGLMIDLSQMRSIQVDPSARTARVGPGATLADLDDATQAHGLATPLGINSTTGVAGLTLGGGFGWLTRKHGLTVDNLRGAEVVLANGRIVETSERQEPDLFWAIRGGGGNFGVVTRFDFDLHPVGPEVYAGVVVYPLDEAPTVLRAWRDLGAQAPLEANAWAVMRQAPPLPFIPESWHGREVLVVPMIYFGPASDGPRVLGPLRTLGRVIGEHHGPQPYTEFQKIFDPLLTPGARNYWKSHDFRALPDDLLDTLVDQARSLPSPECEVFVGQIGGAANRVPFDAMAYPHRDTAYVMNVHARWRDPADDQRCIDWARGVLRATEPWATGGVYVNFMTDDERGRVPAAYGPNHERLAELKGRYDPDNLFRMNHNIQPLVRA